MSLEGAASYYDVVADEKVNPAAAWYYPAPSPAAANIKDHVAFWHGVRIERGEGERGPGLWQRLRAGLSR